MDATLWGNRMGMERAYEFARGESITLPSGLTSRLSKPLDFVAITDHASSFETTEFCFSQTEYPNSEGLCERFEKPSNAYFEKAMKRLRERPVTRYSGFCEDDEDRCLQANATSIYDAATEVDLWKNLSQNCTGSCDFLTIPHNMNLSWGFAFALRTIDGDLYSDADLRLRAASEPIAEIFQSKGASECALGLGIGAVDEECAFEQILQPCLEGETQACASTGSFTREGLKLGLEVQQEKGFNPFKVGFIGSTDTHNSNPGDTQEADYPGSMAMLDDTPEKRYKRDRKRHPRSDRNVLYYNPGGLAAIWAPENTRDALFEAMQRREVYATSGTRIALRMFADWKL